MKVCKVCGNKIEKVSTGRITGGTYYVYFCGECKQVRSPRSIKVIKEEKF